MGEEDPAAAGSESFEDLKSIQENVNPLKRSFPDPDEDEDSNPDSDAEEDEDEDEDDVDDSDADEEEDSSSDRDVEEEKTEDIRNAALLSLFMNEDFFRLARTLEKDPSILPLFLDVLKSLKKKDVTPDDVDEFYAAVSRVLSYESFIQKFYDESASPEGILFLVHVRRFGIVNKMRVDAYGKTEKLMSVIKKDSFFDKISESDDDHMIFCGVLGILLAFCISEPDLERMARLIGIQEPEVWVDGPSPRYMIDNYSITDDD